MRIAWFLIASMLVGAPQAATATPARSGSGKYTEPRLPPREVVRENGVLIEHYTAGGDHGPAHLHVYGNGPDTKIGQNGQVVRGSPPLSAAQRAVVQRNLRKIRNAADAMMRYHRYQQNPGPRPSRVGKKQAPPRRRTAGGSP